jgi:hypothetical protein
VGGFAVGAAFGVPKARAVSANTVKIGNTMPYSGPASTYGVIGRTESAFFAMVNEQGGVAGHTIDFISLDDGYSPPKTVEQIRRLAEEDQVNFTFQTLDTPCNSAIADSQSQEDTASVCWLRCQQMGGHQEVSMDDGFPTWLSYRGRLRERLSAGCARYFGQ